MNGSVFEPRRQKGYHRKQRKDIELKAPEFANLVVKEREKG